jgi:septum formation protein
MAPVLCADTTVALGRHILGKPDNPAHAQAMLTQLAGQTHRVLTSVAVGRLGAAGAPPDTWQALSESRVTFEALGADQIARYVATGEPMGKAGAYGIQGRAALWVSRLTGSYSGIMGLPAFETATVLRQAGIELL